MIGDMMACFWEAGRHPFCIDLLHITVTKGNSSGSISLRISVGIGSREQDLDLVDMINFRTSSVLKISKLLKTISRGLIFQDRFRNQEMISEKLKNPKGWPDPPKSGKIVTRPNPRVYLTPGWKSNFFSREGQIFPGGSNFDIFPENVKYRKLLCVKLLFSWKLPKTDPQAPFWHFSRGGRPLLQGGRTPNPRQFLPCLTRGQLWPTV